MNDLHYINIVRWQSFIFLGNQFKDFCFSPNPTSESNGASQVLQLTKNSIEPVTYTLPKNSRMCRANNIRNSVQVINKYGATDNKCGHKHIEQCFA